MSEAMREIWKVRKEINEETKDMTPEEHRQYYRQAQQDYAELVRQVETKKKKASPQLARKLDRQCEAAK